MLVYGSEGGGWGGVVGCGEEVVAVAPGLGEGGPVGGGCCALACCGGDGG